MNTFYREKLKIETCDRQSKFPMSKNANGKLRYGEEFKEETKYFVSSIHAPYDYKEISESEYNYYNHQNPQEVITRKVKIDKTLVDMKDLKIDDLKELPLDEYVQFVKDNGLHLGVTPYC